MLKNVKLTTKPTQKGKLLTKKATGKSKKSIKGRRDTPDDNILVGQVSLNSVNKIIDVSYPIYSEIISKDKYRDAWIKTTKLFNHLVKHRGPLMGTKRFKEIRTYAIKHSLKVDVDRVSCLSLNKSGFPRDLGHLKEYLYSKDHKQLQMALTILNISRIAQFPKKLTKSDLFSITRGFNQTNHYREIMNSFDAAIPEIFKSLGIPINKDPKDVIDTSKLIHSCTSQGPNSKGRKADATLTSCFDAKAIFNNGKLANNLREVLGLTEDEDFMMYIKDLADTVPAGEKVYHSKIINTPNPENKQRIVAMVDYWTQAILKPYELYLSKIERKVPNSYMFDQDSGREKARIFTKIGLPISLDGTDFTDRFPIELQKIVLKYMFNEESAEKICRLMTDRSFFVEDLDRYVRYQVGQPMGMHCSFHLANITHAIFAIWCCKCTNRGVDDSCVVGDDIIFKYDDSANIYGDRMSKLGLSFSDFKGFSSKETVPVGEFCKKLYLSGEDISGYSPKPFLNVAKDYKNIITLYEHVRVNIEVFGNMVQSAIKPKYHKRCFDLLALLSLIRYSDINAARPFIHRCSENIISLYDDIQEISTAYQQRIASRFLVFQALLEVRKAENKASESIVKTALKRKDYKVRAPRVAKNPVDPNDNIRILDFVRDLASAIMGEIPYVLRKKQADSSDIFTPIGFILNENPDAGKQMETQIRLADYPELCQLLGDEVTWRELLDSVKLSLITGQFTTFARTAKRFDRDNKDKDKKLYLLSNKVRYVYENNFDIHRFQTVLD